MSTSRMSNSSGSSARSKRDVRIAQATADTRLHAAYEDSIVSGDTFDYSKSVDAGKGTVENQLPVTAVTAYLHRMQRGGITQSFGCMVGVDEETFKVLAFSGNALEMLELRSHSESSMLESSVLGKFYALQLPSPVHHKGCNERGIVDI